MAFALCWAELTAGINKGGIMKQLLDEIKVIIKQEGNKRNKWCHITNDKIIMDVIGFIEDNVKEFYDYLWED